MQAAIIQLALTEFQLQGSTRVTGKRPKELTAEASLGCIAKENLDQVNLLDINKYYHFSEA